MKTSSILLFAIGGLVAGISAVAFGEGTAPVKTPTSSETIPALSGNLNEIVKLARSGVDESVILAFVSNSPIANNPSADEIIKLRDLGISSEVISALLRRGGDLRAQYVRAASAQQYSAPMPASSEPSSATYYSGPGESAPESSVTYLSSYPAYSYPYNYSYGYSYYPGYYYPYYYSYFPYYYYPYYFNHFHDHHGHHDHHDGIHVDHHNGAHWTPNSGGTHWSGDPSGMTTRGGTFSRGNTTTSSAMIPHSTRMPTSGMTSRSVMMPRSSVTMPRVGGTSPRMGTASPRVGGGMTPRIGGAAPSAPRVGGMSGGTRAMSVGSGRRG